jgi:hypothetical protein
MLVDLRAIRLAMESPVLFAEKTTQVHPVALPLPTSQYFMAAFCPMRRAVRLWLVFPVPADVPDMSENHDHPAAVFACRKFA